MKIFNKQSQVFIGGRKVGRIFRAFKGVMAGALALHNTDMNNNCKLTRIFSSTVVCTKYYLVGIRLWEAYLLIA